VDELPSPSLLRLARLVKISRLLRVFQLQVFADVLTMIQGIIGGMGTLIWSMVLYVILIYIVALVSRALFGNDPVDYVYENFNTVPRSMFTTFRCSFGDCTTQNGTPIVEFVHQGYGTLASTFCCLFLFTVTIGIFNVISAIFVESTLAAAESMHHAQKNERLQNKKLWNTRITTLLRAMVQVSEQPLWGAKLSESVEQVHQLEIESKLLDDLVQIPAVKQALNDLDINPDDHRYLSELLDPDNGGTITALDFMNGIRRLRGDPRRSDIVHINMMVKSLQLAVSETHLSILEMQPQIAQILRSIPAT